MLFFGLILTILSLFWFTNAQKAPGSRGQGFPLCGSTDLTYLGQPVTYLEQSDFDSGSFRIRKSGYYIFNENIVFNPNANINEPNEPCSYRPCNDINYPGSFYNDTSGPYLLGFFAAVVIEANNVYINMCGYKIAQANAFYLQQRFYAHFEISSAPFLTTQGPFQTGELITVSNIIIEDGALALTSHHGIHGVNVTDVVIRNLDFINFEVAAIHINGAVNLEICDIRIGRSSDRVTVNGFYSNGRFLLPKLENLIYRIPDAEINFADRGETLKLIDIYDELKLQMDLYFKYTTDVISINDIQAYSDSDYTSLLRAIQLFQNPLRIQDCGAAYGIVVNSIGVAVNNFGDGLLRSNNITIENVVINSIFLNAKEIVGYRPIDGIGQAKGPHGDVFDMLSVVYNIDIYSHYNYYNNLESFKYNGNALSDAQIALGKYSISFEEGNTNTITNEMLEWIENENSTLNGTIFCNQDVMEHLNKGIIALRIDETDNIKINNININNLNNWSQLGTNICGGYNGPNNGGHIAQFDNTNYQGGDVRGISLFNSNNIKLNNISITNINSQNGNAKGIDIMHNSTNINLGTNIQIKYINAGQQCNQLCIDELESNSTPNDVPEACGVHFDFNFDPTQLNGLNNTNITAVDGPLTC